MFPPELLTLLFLSIVIPADLVVSDAPFSTLAIATVNSSTVVCALVSALPFDGTHGLNCTGLPGGKLLEIPSGDVPYSAIVGGDGFLCGVMSPEGGHTAMRWWTFDEDDRPAPVGERIYWGSKLSAISSGGAHVCGILGQSWTPECWLWNNLTIPGGLNFSEIAVGRDFLCGLISGESTVRCIGNDMDIVNSVPDGSFVSISAGSRHACGLRNDGVLKCWGPGSPPEITDLPEDMVAMELGLNMTCLLSSAGRVHCYGENAAVPVDLAGLDFIAIEVYGDTVCGVLSANYSVACWGSNKTNLVFNRAMPGKCVPMTSCQCGLLPGTADLCLDAGYAVCNTCKMALGSLASASPSSTSPPVPIKAAEKMQRKLVYVIVGVLFAGLGAWALAFFIIRHVPRRFPADDAIGLMTTIEVGGDLGMSPVTEKSYACEEFSLRELTMATEGFSDSRRVGIGSFGSVYRGTLLDDRNVAIKRAERRGSSSCGRRRQTDSERAFRSELALLSRVNHRNLVGLLGYCEEHGERILVYEFMPQGALHDHIHGTRFPTSPLAESWPERLRVALDAARGVEYLHSYAVPPVIHRDIKPSNILLDADWTAKISDFGLSLFRGTAGQPATAGTVGYMDPEYYKSQELTEKSDVYSFGVVLLEIITGRRAVDKRPREVDGCGGAMSPQHVAQIAVPAVEAGEIFPVLDDRLAPPAGRVMEAVTRVAKLAAECVRTRGRCRPAMKEVVAELEKAVRLCDAVGFGVLSGSKSRSGSDSAQSTHEFHWGFGFGSRSGSTTEPAKPI